MATTNLGRVIPLLKREYSASKEYELNDIVSYNGSLYWHYSDAKTTGTAPTDTTVWAIVLDVRDAEEFVERSEDAADSAQQSAEEIEDLTVTAIGLAEGATPTATKTKAEGHPYNIQFGIPKGDKGNVLYATFDVDPETGVLSMTTPTGYQNINFTLNNGVLEVEING